MEESTTIRNLFSGGKSLTGDGSATGLLLGDERSRSLTQSFSADSSTTPTRQRSSSWQRRRSSSERRTSCEMFKTSKGGSKLTPFYLRWSYGNNNMIPAINLSMENRKLIYYASAHAAVLYDYEAREMRLLQGHQNPINSISADGEGRWVVTSDAGEDNAVIVWDSTNCMPLKSLFNPHVKYAPQRAVISKNSKYLITVGNEPQPVIKFWLWTHGREAPDAIYEAEGNCGKLKTIKFSPNCHEHILFTFENQVLFGKWLLDSEKFDVHVPEINLKGKGKLMDSTYVYKSHNAISCTSAGRAIIFANTIYTCPFKDAPLNNRKQYIKSIIIQPECINVIESVDGIVVTGDVRGAIRFYDACMRILYWVQKFNLDSIRGISFNPGKRLFKFEDPLVFIDDSVDSQNDDTDMVQRYETLYTQNVPSDATLQMRPFIVRDFIVFTAKGLIGKIAFLENTCEFLTDMAETRITAIATHDEKNILVIGNANGRLQAYNLTSHFVTANYTLPVSTEATEENTYPPCEITCLEFSPGGLHLACGMANGSIWMLDVNTLETKTAEPYCVSVNSIAQICFSHDSVFMAHYDLGMKVCLYYHHTSDMQWYFIGKMRSHYKPIRDITFSQGYKLGSKFPKLFTIGEDRHLVEYDIEKSIDKNELCIRSAERVEQSAIPQCFIWSGVKHIGPENFFLVADDQYKFKYWNDTTAMTHRTILGPTFGSPIQRMRMLPEMPPTKQIPVARQYIVFGTNRQIGIQMLPPDGNPYRYVGMIGHPTKLTQFCVSSDGKYLFTLGEADTCVLMWQINIRAVDVMCRIGGKGLDPYYCLIDGGQNGWLFNEMKDLFYYMQILHQGENTAAPREVSTKISIGELPDLMRSVGFYPTEYEVENMIIDVKYRNFDETRSLVVDIEFEEFVKLYINHRPAFGINLESVREAFDVFSSNDDIDETSMSRCEFLDVMCYTGECFTPDSVKKYLSILLHHQEEEQEEEEGEDKCFLFVPEEIRYSTFLEDILGIDSTNENSIITDSTYNTKEY